LGTRRQELIKHEVATLVEQRGCVELIDHDRAPPNQR
jgi:hypothetical protein